MKNTTKTKKNKMSDEEMIEWLFVIVGLLVVIVVGFVVFAIHNEPTPFIIAHEGEHVKKVTYNYDAIDLVKKYNVTYSQAVNYLDNIEEIKRQFRSAESLEVMPEIVPVMVESVGAITPIDISVEEALDHTDYFITTYQPESLGSYEDIYDKAKFVYGSDYDMETNILNIWKFKFIALTDDDLDFIMKSPMINRPVIIDRYGIIKQYPDQVQYSSDYLTLIENGVGLD